MVRKALEVRTSRDLNHLCVIPHRCMYVFFPYRTRSCALLSSLLSHPHPSRANEPEKGIQESRDPAKRHACRQCSHLAYDAVKSDNDAAVHRSRRSIGRSSVVLSYVPERGGIASIRGPGGCSQSERVESTDCPDNRRPVGLSAAPRLLFPTAAEGSIYYI
jgi:hypothetical protein